MPNGQQLTPEQEQAKIQAEQIKSNISQVQKYIQTQSAITTYSPEQRAVILGPAYQELGQLQSKLETAQAGLPVDMLLKDIRPEPFMTPEARAQDVAQSIKEGTRAPTDIPSGVSETRVQQILHPEQFMTPAQAAITGTVKAGGGYVPTLESGGQVKILVPPGQAVLKGTGGYELLPEAQAQSLLVASAPSYLAAAPPTETIVYRSPITGREFATKSEAEKAIAQEYKGLSEYQKSAYMEKPEPSIVRQMFPSGIPITTTETVTLPEKPTTKEGLQFVRASAIVGAAEAPKVISPTKTLEIKSPVEAGQVRSDVLAGLEARQEQVRETLVSPKADVLTKALTFGTGLELAARIGGEKVFPTIAGEQMVTAVPKEIVKEAVPAATVGYVLSPATALIPAALQLPIAVGALAVSAPSIIERPVAGIGSLVGFGFGAVMGAETISALTPKPVIEIATEQKVIAETGSQQVIGIRSTIPALKTQFIGQAEVVPETIPGITESISDLDLGFRRITVGGQLVTQKPGLLGTPLGAKTIITEIPPTSAISFETGPIEIKVPVPGTKETVTVISPELQIPFPKLLKGKLTVSTAGETIFKTIVPEPTSAALTITTPTVPEEPTFTSFVSLGATREAQIREIGTLYPIEKPVAEIVTIPTVPESLLDIYQIGGGTLGTTKTELVQVSPIEKQIISTTPLLSKTISEQVVTATVERGIVSGLISRPVMREEELPITTGPLSFRIETPLVGPALSLTQRTEPTQVQPERITIKETPTVATQQVPIMISPIRTDLSTVQTQKELFEVPTISELPSIGTTEIPIIRPMEFPAIKSTQEVRVTQREQISFKTPVPLVTEGVKLTTFLPPVLKKRERFVPTGIRKVRTRRIAFVPSAVPDLISQAIAESRYGRATAPPTKTLFKFQKAYPVGYQPTAEMVARGAERERLPRFSISTYLGELKTPKVIPRQTASKRIASGLGRSLGQLGKGLPSLSFGRKKK